MKLTLLSDSIQKQIQTDIAKTLELESKLDILHFLLKDKVFLEHTRTLISPELFPKEYREIVELTLNFFDKYHIAPDISIKELLPKEKHSTVTKLLNRTISDKEQRRQYLLDTMLSIYRSYLTKIGYQKTQEILENVLNEHKPEEEVLKATDTIIQLWADIKEQTAKFTHYGIEMTDISTMDSFFKQIKKQRKKAIKTGYSELDKYLDNGSGIKNGDVFLIQAPTGVGKSMFMMNLAINMLLQGKWFIYITLELNEEQVYKRMIKILANDFYYQQTPNYSHTLSFEDLREYIQNLLDTNKNKIGRGRIIYASPRNYTISDIQILLYRLRTLYNFVPDVLFIDYADYLSPTKGYKERRFEIERIFLDLQELSDEINVPIFTASQVGRYAANRQNITNEDSAEAYFKSQIADVVMGLNYSNEISNTTIIKNRKVKRLVGYISKNRLGERNVKINFVQDNETTRMALEKGDQIIHSISQLLSESDNQEQVFDDGRIALNNSILNQSDMEDI